MTVEGPLLGHALAQALRGLRQTLLAGSGLMILSGSASAEVSDANWLERFLDPTGSKTADSRPAPRPVEPDQVNDLRTDSTPFRSDEMAMLLDGAIQRYGQIRQAGGWAAIPGSRLIRPGDDDARVPAVRKRLLVTGELPEKYAQNVSSYAFDDALQDAVKRFQETHGLRPSGRVDRPTLEALNVPVEARLEQLKLNQRRIRELLQGRIEDRYILVNVPAFQLEAVDKFEVKQRHRVIVGKPDRQTPSVKATVRAVNFFPMWHVPESVAGLDLIPRLLKEPEYLTKEKIRVFSGSYTGPELDPTTIDWRQADPAKIKFRQDPGPQDALGLVRIDMSNEYGVYMHDTPMKPLFGQRGRAFSAGCVRVQGVFDLVSWITSIEPGWQDKGRVMAQIDSGQPLDVPLTRPVPVYFTYITAWAEPDGRIMFTPDVYGRDGLSTLTAGRDRDPNDPAPVQASLAP